MSFLTRSELITHLRTEIVDEVQQEENTAIDAAIAAAISEMRGYINMYDVDTILATTGTNREPVLLMYTKDIAVWHFIQLANPNIDMELREKRYDMAINWLRGVQKGTIVPNLPLPAATENNPYPGKIKFGSNAKRNTHF
ncbi:MAG: DUF1320 family protein [Chitinophagaceae bacterium]|nr:DUF1320 family protein [Chitinophagaceae bacterium]